MNPSVVDSTEIKRKLGSLLTSVHDLLTECHVVALDAVLPPGLRTLLDRLEIDAHRACDIVQSNLETPFTGRQLVTFLHLPDEIVSEVFCFLDPASIASAARTCSRFARVVRHSFSLWRTQYQRYFADVQQHSPGRLREVFARRWPSEAQWRNGVCRLFTHRHPFPASGCLSFDGKHFVSGDREGSVTLCEATSDRCCVRTWAVHPKRPLSIVHEAATFWCASGDVGGNILFWNVASGQSHYAKRSAHDGAVVALARRGDVCSSASLDSTVKLWSVETGTAVSSIDLRSPVFSMTASENENCLIFASTKNGLLHVIDARAPTAVLHSVADQARASVPFTSLSYCADTSELACASDRGLHIASLRRGGGGPLLQFDGFHSTAATGLTRVHYNGRRAVCGSTSGSLLVLDTYAGRVLRDMPQHQSPITALNVCGDVAITAALNGLIKVWDFRVRGVDHEASASDTDTSGLPSMASLDDEFCADAGTSDPMDD